MKNISVVAISGWKQSGKDTMANFLTSEYGYFQFSFASSLKDMVAEQYDIPRNSLDDNALKEQPLPQYPVVSKDPFNDAIHRIMWDSFRDYKVDNIDEVEFIKCWTPRALAILEGSVKRSVTSSYWVDRVINNIKDHADTIGNTPFQPYYVISDLRYISEVEQLRAAFGDNLKTVRINRFDDVDTMDPSERDLDNAVFDTVIDNKSDRESFIKNIRDLAYTYKCLL